MCIYELTIYLKNKTKTLYVMVWLGVSMSIVSTFIISSICSSSLSQFPFISSFSFLTLSITLFHFLISTLASIYCFELFSDIPFLSFNMSLCPQLLFCFPSASVSIPLSIFLPLFISSL